MTGLVPRPTCGFHFSVAVGLVPFLRGRGKLQFSDNKGINTLRSLFVSQTER